MILREGLLLDFEFYVGYKLTTKSANTDAKKIDQLMNIYKTCGGEWDIFLEMLVLAEVRDVAAQYGAFDFFQKREVIGTALFNNIYQVFQDYNFELL